MRFILCICLCLCFSSLSRFGRGLGAKRGFRVACDEPAQRLRLASRSAHCK